ncbi:DUF1289 domain-containing protein [Afipia massiliensis]|uniref:DUF1289 domain-containing protein n=1 Tax=Afipia massiliensis TaxID=211460 RepID=A0A4U6BSQ2_9BRAD|nr:DUF1289 domain-containing protein [Afipia massiliensis]TKT73612.1 DUF1289 domain-containing protein [Afipia massiliensis]
MNQEATSKQETPCIAVCFIDPKAKLCLGCGRTLPEIASWHKMDNAERRAVMATLHQRMLDAGLPILASPSGRQVGS